MLPRHSTTANIYLPSPPEVAALRPTQYWRSTGRMLRLRNLALLRRLYVHALNLITRLAYGPDALRRRPVINDGGVADRRIRRINSELEFGPVINSELEFGPGAWEGGFLDAASESKGAPGGADGIGGGRRSEGGALSEFRRTGAAFEKERVPFRFEDAGACLADGMDAIVGDSLTRCFTAEPSEPWNFLTRNLPPGQWTMSPYMTLMWLLGLWGRYCVLLPIRLLVLVCGSASFCAMYAFVGLVFPAGDSGERSWKTMARKTLLKYLASVFVASWSGYIRVHGKRPERKANQIYVANHASLIDVFVLVRDYNFSFIGQRHTGLAGALQDLIGTAQEHVWFDREEGRDRKAVQSLLKAHVANGSKEPMLVFPEGTCTTTEYCIMFKKGSFELGATVHPIAMRYRKEFGDAYWNSSQSTFLKHLFDLMTAWALVCDVYYLDPMTIAPGETTVQFANRVKNAICARAGLISVNWDGFLKRHRISPKFLAQRQKAMAAAITRRLDGEVPRPWSHSSLSTLTGPKAFDLFSNPSRPPLFPTIDSAGGKRGDPSVLNPSRISNGVDVTPLARSDSSKRSKSISSLLNSRGALMKSNSSTAAPLDSRSVLQTLSVAATESARWGFAFLMLALAGGITAMMMSPKSTVSALRKQVVGR